MEGGYCIELITIYYLVATGLLALTSLLVVPLRAHAVLGVGDTVFDPTMYATQLLQLEQATATVTNLA